MDTLLPDRLASRNRVIRETDLPRPARPLSRTNQPTINHPLVTSFVPSILSTRPPAPESDNRRPEIPEKQTPVCPTLSYLFSFKNRLVPLKTTQTT
jgi:hypothetical protein